MTVTRTRERVLGAALTAFGRRGYDATSLDLLAADLGVRKQTILYYFPSKEILLQAVVDQAATEMTAALEESLGRPGAAWDRVRAVVRAVFHLAARRPELLGLLREVTRLGPPAATRFATILGPLIDRATGFLEEAMARGELRPQDARLLLLVTYSSVVGAATEVEVLRALGVEPTARTLVKQRAALLTFLRSALSPSG
jgi:AcrR family transcriptional regulator